MIKEEEKVRKWEEYWEKDNHWHVIQFKLHLFITIEALLLTLLLPLQTSDIKGVNAKQELFKRCCVSQDHHVQIHSS